MFSWRCSHLTMSRSIMMFQVFAPSTFYDFTLSTLQDLADRYIQVENYLPYAYAASTSKIEDCLDEDYQPNLSSTQFMLATMSDESMTKSRAILEDRVGIQKPLYHRPKHDRTYCKLCDSHPDGFRGEHELRRHVDRMHRETIRKWVCVEPTDGNDHPMPIKSLSRCNQCSGQKKSYGAWYNAAAHLRRAHFNPKTKGRSKSQQTIGNAKEGLKVNINEPSMLELKNHWMKEVEERVDVSAEPGNDPDTESIEDFGDLDPRDNLDDDFLVDTFHGRTKVSDYPAEVGVDDLYDVQDLSIDPSGPQSQYHDDESHGHSSPDNFPLLQSETLNPRTNDSKVGQ